MSEERQLTMENSERLIGEMLECCGEDVDAVLGA